MVSNSDGSQNNDRHILDGIDLLAAMTDAISVQDTTFKILYQNPAHKRLMGEHVGEYCYSAYQHKDKVCEGCHLAQTFRDGLCHQRETSAVTDQGLSYVEIYTSPLRDANGTVIAGIESIRDVSRRRENEEKLRLQQAAMETSTDGICIFDLVVDSCKYVNRAYANIFGYDSAEELLGRSWHLLFPPDKITNYEGVKESFQREGKWRGEFTGMRKDGSTFPVQISATMIENGNAVAVVSDITERKRADELLRQSEERYRRIVEQSSAWIWEMDANLRHTFSNEFGENLYDYSLDELRTMELSDLLHPDDVAEVEEIVDRAKNGKQGWQGKILRWRTKNGRVIYLESNGSPLFDAEGEFIGLSGVDIDVTAKVLAEENLRKSEQSLRSIIDANPEPQFLIERDGTIIKANRALTKRLAKSFDEVEGHNVNEFGPPDLHERRMALAEEVFRSGKPRLFMDSRNGLELENHFYPVFDQNGTVSHLAVLSIDVTEKNQLHRQLMNTQRLDSLGVLAGGIAHDFNNILTAIIGNAELALMRMNPESPALDNLQRIEMAAGRAADLARQMLAYSGKGKFVVEPINLSLLVEEMGNMLEVSISKKAALCYNLAHPLPAVEADATQIRQIIMNLVINASEAIGDREGIIHISTGSLQCDEKYLQETWLTGQIPEGLYVFVEVADNGCGMDKETLDKMFDPFFTTKFTGRGLGMSAVLGIIRGHKGAIKVYSEPEKGSSFKVLLPASERPAEVIHDNAAVGWKGEGTVLLVDDEETVLGIGSEMLAELGFTPITANDGREAVELFRNTPGIVFVILDLTMPHMDGGQCFRELRQLDPKVKVIISSGFSEHEVTRKFAGEGLAGFVQKPYRLSDLKDTIMRLT